MKLLFIFAWLVSLATSSDINNWSAGAGDFWAEHYPWPYAESDAVKQCVFAIQSRHWQNYQGCLELSTILTRTAPGLPG